MAAYQPVDDRLAYSIAEAIRVSGIGRTSFYAALRRQELAARKYGRRTLILKSDLSNWLASMTPADFSRGN